MITSRSYVLILLLLLFVCGCGNEKEAINDITKISQKNQIKYTLNVNLYEIKNFEVFINGVKLYSKYDTGLLSILNPYLLKNGSATVKLKFKPENNLEIDNSFLDGKYRKLQFGNFWEDKNGNQHDVVSEILPFKKLDKPVKEFEQEWEMVIDKLPYELKGWSNSKVFKYSDSLLIKTKVEAYYQNLWNILNNERPQNKSIQPVVTSLKYHLETILNFIDNKRTNANAESFNSKIKLFRANHRGVVDIKFFLFRIEKLFT